MDNGNELRDEINSKIFDTSLNVDSYLKVRNSINTTGTEYDDIRIEICKCISMNYNQASITLTNHLLEKFLRHSIIYFEVGFHQVTTLDVFDEMAVCAEKYNKATLEPLINKAKSLLLISKEQAKQLKKFNIDIRNPYSHGNGNQIFKDDGVGGFALGSLNGVKETQFKEVSRNAMLPFHGFMQAGKALADSIPYFLYVDNLILENHFKKFPQP
jgi:hypothetical protein